jgi:sec-independent protein translocase protein TatA
MGDVAGGIKAFKKGMAEDDTPPKTDPKTIDHQAQNASPAPSANPADAKARADS